ncbi:hypothetical protein [Roseateles sp.]|uniref:hypothetical protein n=1 Tax=Roseateles sp. TaxID=1971397 RepID=UPI002E0B9BB2|nr:hypothetical protein [Roseateles sp.]
MATKINRLKTAVSAVASSGLGAFTIGAAAAGFRTFGAGQNGQAFDGVLISEGSAWELRSGCVYTHSGTSLSRGTLEDSSTGSAIAFTAAAVVTVSQSAAELARVHSVSDIAFSTAIPLTAVGTAYMPQQTVSSVLAFTLAASPVRGAQVYLRLVADGTNAPTFTGIKEWGGSMGYDNRPGIVNNFEFFYDGYDAWFTVAQQVGATPVDLVAPTIATATVENAAPTVVVLAGSEALDAAFVPAASAFTVSGHTVSSVAISGSNINLTVSAAFVNGEAARTAAYTQPGSNNVRDVAGNLLANFSDLSITNNVGAASQIVRLTGLQNTTESGDGTSGWNYASTLSGFGSNGGVCDLSFPNATDCEVYLTLGNVSSGRDVVLGLDSVSGNSKDVFSADYGIWTEGDGKLTKCTNGSTTTAGAAGTMVTGNKMRLKRVGSTITAAKYSGGVWTDMATWTGASTGQLFIGINFSGSGAQANDLRGAGLA